MRHTVRNLFPLALLLFTLLLAWLTHSLFSEAAVQRVVSDEVEQKSVMLDRLQAQLEHSYRLQEMSWLQESLTALATEPGLVSTILVDENGVVIGALRRDQVGLRLEDVLDGQAEDGLRQFRRELFIALGDVRRSEILVSENAAFLGAVYPVDLVRPDSGLAGSVTGYLWLEKDLRPQVAVALEQVRLQTLALTVGLGFLALCLGVLFHVVVTRRISKLIAATQRVGGGDLDARVRITSNDEFGVLGRYFNEMLDRRRVVEKALTQTQKLESIGTLAGGIAHDFNNILQAISGYSRLARARTDTTDKILVDYFDRIDIGAGRAKALVEQILSFSSATDGDVRVLALEDVARDALQLIRSTLPASIRIHLVVDNDVPLVQADPTQLQQVITNLSTNAMHSMEAAGGDLTISIQVTRLAEPLQTLSGRVAPGDYVELVVSDTGAGIPDEYMDRLMDPFFTTKEVGRGTGLGLSIVHGIVTFMQGGLLINSVKDIGTDVRVLLPAADEQASLLQDKEKTDRHVLAAAPGRVLLVDDEQAITDSTSLLLREEGCEVAVLNDATRVEDFVTEHADELDVAILDYTMPDMSGIMLAERLQSICPRLPVIIATGMLDSENFGASRPDNVVAVVRKPYDMKGLLREIGAVSGARS